MSAGASNTIDIQFSSSQVQEMKNYLLKKGLDHSLSDIKTEFCLRVAEHFSHTNLYIVKCYGEEDTISICLAPLEEKVADERYIPSRLKSARKRCNILKAQIIMCMSDEVKEKIRAEGLTLDHVAADYILRAFQFAQHDEAEVNFSYDNKYPHTFGLNLYKNLVFDQNYQFIIDIKF